MNKKIIYILVASALVFFIISLVVFLQSNKEPREDRVTTAAEEKIEEEINKAEFLSIKAFFFSEKSRLMKPVLVEVESRGIREELYSKLMDILLQGEEEYITPIPVGVSLRSLYFIKEEELLVLDFNEDLVQRFPSGTAAEIEFIYFLVDNFCYNFKEIKKVKFLAGGNDLKTISGHIDMENPFFPDWGYLVDQ